MNDETTMTSGITKEETEEGWTYYYIVDPIHFGVWRVTVTPHHHTSEVLSNWHPVPSIGY